MPIPEIQLFRAGVSAVILAEDAGNAHPRFEGLSEALQLENADVKIFGKPNTRPYRRMAVALTHGPLLGDMAQLRQHAKRIADQVVVHSQHS